jgi:hypothetical protein
VKLGLGSHAIYAEDILEVLAHFFHLCTVAMKACMCTIINDVIREDAGQHRYILERINVSE